MTVERIRLTVQDADDHLWRAAVKLGRGKAGLDADVPGEIDYDDPDVQAARRKLRMALRALERPYAPSIAAVQAVMRIEKEHRHASR